MVGEQGSRYHTSSYTDIKVHLIIMHLNILITLGGHTSGWDNTQLVMHGLSRRNKPLDQFIPPALLVRPKG